VPHYLLDNLEGSGIDGRLNIKMDLKSSVCVDGIHVTHDEDLRWAVMSTLVKLCIFVKLENSLTEQLQGLFHGVHEYILFQHWNSCW
jgi:hypothetical protein